jgi:MraZ protein
VGERWARLRGSVIWLGESNLSLDDKGRVVIPRRLQAGLDHDPDGRSVAVVTRGFEGCLFVFAESAFAQLLGRMRTRAFDGAAERKMQRLFFANAHRSTLDGAGRLLIPEKLRKLVGMEKEVVVVGLIDRLEIWPRSAWEAFEARNAGDFDQLSEVLCGDDDPVEPQP